MTRFVLHILIYSLLLYLVLLFGSEVYEPTREFRLSMGLLLIRYPLLFIHESGHFFFGFFGELVMYLGGTIMQILVPLVWYGVAVRENSLLRYIALYVTGFSMIDVSVYVKDAGMLLLPLIGGLSKTHHDWANIMNMLDLIPESYTIGEVVFWLGMMLSCVSIGVALFREWQIFQTPRIKEDNHS